MYGLEIISKGGTTIIDSNFSNYVITEQGTAETGQSWNMRLTLDSTTIGGTNIYLGTRGLLFVELSEFYSYTMVNSYIEGFSIPNSDYVKICADPMNPTDWFNLVTRQVNYFVAQPYDILGEPTPTGYGLAIYKANGTCGFTSQYPHHPIIGTRLITTAELDRQILGGPRQTPLLTPIKNMEAGYKIYACINGTGAYETGATVGFKANDSYAWASLLTISKKHIGTSGFTYSLRIGSRKLITRYRSTYYPTINYYQLRGTRSILVAAKI